MKIGDRVEWTSQSGSYRRTKNGVILAVVPAQTPPDRCVPQGYRCGSPAGFGMRRDHESYLVKVEGKGRGLYWPRVRHLHLPNPELRGGARQSDVAKQGGQGNAQQ